jgi:phosphodiesterase/alkaline phosphatase D-like protein
MLRSLQKRPRQRAVDLPGGLTSMPHLIIGDTSDTSARIWVRGDKSCTCDVSIYSRSPDHSARQQVHLASDTDHTGTVDFKGLTPNTEYAVEAKFASGNGTAVRGRFRTFPESTATSPAPFSFVLSSCNLSVVSINNLLALLVAVTGVKAADRSLDLPLARWQFPKLVWLRALSRPLAKCVLKLVAGFVKKATKMKQPPPPYLRSPFLKLSAVFESQVLEITTRKSLLPMVGDVIFVRSGAEGVVASAAAEIEVSPKVPVRDEEGQDPLSQWRLVLTHVEGTFAERAMVWKRGAGDSADDAKTVGTIAQVLAGRQWYKRPSFFIHAGDQIYYDFPYEDRKPDRNEYRLAYREAWFDDYSNRHLLSHWPHYMTLDDHELADQFARDFKSTTGVSPDTYRGEASVAYREYVQARQPPEETFGRIPRRPAESFWYRFDKGCTRFFVLDTRTQRFDGRGAPAQILDDIQMAALLEWMTTYKNDLKFVVTSVPFVAEINEHPSDPTPKWIRQRRSNRPTPQNPAEQDENPANDKWCALRFRRQRSQIIEHIASKGIEHLVFLAGDLHCCYHASMRIGKGSKYESITIHELGGGPVNQLQIANVTEFHTRHSARTLAGIEYEVVLDRFHGDINGVMHVGVSYGATAEILETGLHGLTPSVEWQVIRTLTDDGADAWIVDSSAPRTQAPEATMAGRITFVRKRNASQLQPWPWATA